MCLGCLSPSVILSLEDFQMPNAISTPSYELRLLTTMEKYTNTGIKIVSPSTRLDTVIPISSDVSCLEDHGVQGKPYNLSMVVAMLFLWQPFAGHSLSGYETYLTWYDKTPHYCWQCGGEHGCMNGHSAAGTKALR